MSAGKSKADTLAAFNPFPPLFRCVRLMLLVLNFWLAGIGLWSIETQHGTLTSMYKAIKDFNDFELDKSGGR